MLTGNEPIHHITGANGVPFNKSEIDKDLVFNNMFSGLTIRQHFAAMFTAAYINNPRNNYPIDFESNATDGVKQADALINELNKTKAQ